MNLPQYTADISLPVCVCDSLSLRYMLYCNSNYYGSYCSVYCVARDTDTSGHYTCHSRTGSKVCRSGRNTRVQCRSSSSSSSSSSTTTTPITDMSRSIAFAPSLWRTVCASILRQGRLHGVFAKIDPVIRLPDDQIGISKAVWAGPTDRSGNVLDISVLFLYIYCLRTVSLLCLLHCDTNKVY